MRKEWDFRTAPGNLSHLSWEVVFQRRVEVNQFLGCLYVRYMLEKDSPLKYLLLSAFQISEKNLCSNCIKKLMSFTWYIL